MKKILAIILALSLLSSGFTAFADIVVDDSNSGTGGFGGNNVEVEDTLDDEELKGPVGTPLYFNDFENCGEFTG